MIKKRFLSMLVLLAAVATSAVAQETYKVSVKSGTVDAASWTITPPEATTTGVAAGTPVTATYIGTKKVKSVKAVKKAALINNPAVGQVIGSDGINYDRTATLPSGVTAVAMIAYVGSETGVEGYTNGLALALNDKGEMIWSEATGTSGAAAHTPAAPTTTSSWMLPSKDQWNKMIDACKNVLGTNNDFQDLRDGFTSVGGSNLKSKDYWSSTEYYYDEAWMFNFDYDRWYDYPKDEAYPQVRACLAF